MSEKRDTHAIFERSGGMLFIETDEPLISKAVADEFDIEVDSPLRRTIPLAYAATREPIITMSAVLKAILAVAADRILDAFLEQFSKEGSSLEELLEEFVRAVEIIVKSAIEENELRTLKSDMRTLETAIRRYTLDEQDDMTFLKSLTNDATKIRNRSNDIGVFGKPISYQASVIEYGLLKYQRAKVAEGFKRECEILCDQMDLAMKEHNREIEVSIMNRFSKINHLGFGLYSYHFDGKPQKGFKKKGNKIYNDHISSEISNAKSKLLVPWRSILRDMREAI